MTPRIIELLIEDEDDNAGLDGIALVENPAHEAVFEYFKDQEQKKESRYVLSDEEVPRVIQMFQAYGEPQGFLEKDGWIISEVKHLGQQEFSNILADPNAPSAQDTPEVRFRYKYVGPSDGKNRTFCAEMMSANRVFRIEDIDEMSTRSVNPVGPSGYSVFEWRGSFNCRHKWVQLIYRREGKIINKSSVRKGLIDEDGMPGPDTRTTATIKAGNTPPRTGFASEGNPNVSALAPYVDQVTDEVERHPVLASEEGNMNVLGFQTRFFQMCPKAIELFQHLISMPLDEETEGMVRSAAQIADNIFRIESEVIDKGISSPEDMVQAELLVSDFKDLIHEIDEEVGMIHETTFMDGHLMKIQSYLEMADLEDACWPGYEAIGTKDLNGREVPNCVPEKMAMEMMKQEFQSYNDYPESAKNNACKAIKWKEEHGDEVKGMTQVGWVRANQLCKGENISEETIARMSGFQRHRKNAEVAPEFKDTPWKDNGYVAWLGWGGTTGVEWASKKLESIRNDMSFSVFNADQKLVVGAAMIPDKMIIRRNEITGDIYYVYFTADTIKKLQQKFMKDKLLDATNIEHQKKFLRDVDVVESWIVEDPEKDKQQVFGMNYPAGTWMIIMKVNDNDTWSKVKDGKLKGFSVQGYFIEKAKFSTQDKDIVEQIKSILKEVK
jgi:hypothetical protein